MRYTALISILVMFLVGCDRPSSRPDAATQKAPAQSTEGYIAGWGHMGMRLPDADQVKVFRNNFDTAHDSLSDALSHSDHAVRMRAAYVIGKIGAAARPAGKDLLARLTEEPEALVRIYIVNALNAIGYNSEAAITVLAERYEALDGANVPPDANLSYAEVDEKIVVASALYSILDDDSKSEYFEFVTKWLGPPDDNLSAAMLDGYWERRLIAVNSLERMPDARDAIPLLESLQSEPDAKSWVHVHVPRVLDVLRVNDR